MEKKTNNQAFIFDESGWFSMSFMKRRLKNKREENIQVLIVQLTWMLPFHSSTRFLICFLIVYSENFANYETVILELFSLLMN